MKQILITQKERLALQNLMNRRISSPYFNGISAVARTIKERKNEFVENNEIPLGINTFNGNKSSDKIITMPYTESGALGIVGISRTGKTTLMKRIASYFLYFYNKKFGTKRPGLILDLQSEDWHLIKYPNPAPHPLFWKQNETPVEVKNLVNYAPTFTKDEAHPFDKIFGFDLSKLTRRDMRGFELTTPSIRTLYQLMENNKHLLNNPEEFLRCLEKYPCNDRDMERLQEDPNYKMKIMGTINYSTKTALITFLETLLMDRVFISKNDPNYKKDFIEDLKNNKIVNINLHQYQEFAPLIGGMILRDLYFARRDHARRNDESLKGPVVIIEEADLLLPKEDTHLQMASTKYLTEILRRGGKYNFYSIIATQQASNLHPQCKEHTRQWIIGPSLTSSDYNFFKNIFSSEVLNTIRNLNPAVNEWGAREWCIVYNKFECDTFIPYTSPFALYNPNVTT